MAPGSRWIKVCPDFVVVLVIILLEEDFLWKRRLSHRTEDEEQRTRPRRMGRESRAAGTARVGGSREEREAEKRPAWRTGERGAAGLRVTRSFHSRHHTGAAGTAQPRKGPDPGHASVRREFPEDGARWVKAPTSNAP